MRKRRQRKGNMLVLMALVTVLISAVILIGILLSALFGQHSRSQYDVDAFALSLAKEINSNDRVARLNQMVARSRELVFVTRQDINDCAKLEMYHIEPLYNQLIDEAYESQATVENERQSLIKAITNDVRKSTYGYNSARNLNNNSILPWLQTFEPEVHRVNLGYINNVESNVQSLYGVEELADFDRKKGYVQKETDLYKSNIDAKLPSPDDRLDFYFSALPASVENTTAPPRVANPDVFKSYSNVFDNGKEVPRQLTQIPQAVQLHSKMDVSLDPEGLNRHSINVQSVGVTGGALSKPE